MKKNIFYFAIAVLGYMSLALTSCSTDKYEEKENPVKVVSAETLISAAGGSKNITVEGQDITAQSADEWLTVTTNGNVITVTAPENPGLEMRHTIVTILGANGGKQIVNVSQYGLLLLFDEGNQITCSDDENNLIVSLTHSLNVSVESFAEWLTAKLSDDGSAIELAVKSNEITEERIGKVAVKSGNYTDTLYVLQDAMVFDIEKTSIAAPNEGGIQSVTIEHSKPVTVETTSDWLEIAFNDMTNVLTVSIDENKALARKGSITVKSGKMEKTISILQYDPASLGDQMLGDYYFTYYNEEGALKAFAATLTEDALVFPAYNWSIPVTIDKEKLTVSFNSGCLLGTLQGYYIYLIFVDETDQYWSGNSTKMVATVTLGLEDVGGGILSLVGDFDANFSNSKLGYFIFAVFTAPTLDVSDDSLYYTDLLYAFNPGLMKVPAEEEAAPAMLRRTPEVKLVPTFSRKRFKK